MIDKNRDKDPKSEFCRFCKYFNDDPCCGQQCNKEFDYCGNYKRFVEIYDRLAELEDKIENGTLAELPCKVGDTAMAIIDTLAYDNSLQRVKIEGLAYIVKDENGDITFQHINRLFSNEAEAEARLKELQEKEECR